MVGVASLIPERSSFYDMIWDILTKKIALKCLFNSSSKQILIRSLKWCAKSFFMSIGYKFLDRLSGQSKNFRPFGSKVTFFMSSYSELLFNSRPAPLLGTHSSTAHGKNVCFMLSIPFESPDTYPSGKKIIQGSSSSI